MYDGGDSLDHLDYSLDPELPRVIVYGKSKYIVKHYKYVEDKANDSIVNIEMLTLSNGNDIFNFEYPILYCDGGIY
jgi:hypothetical protein